MDETPIPANGVTLTASQLKDAGISTVQELTATLKRAVERGSDQDHLERIAEALMAQSKAMTEAVQGLTSKAQLSVESDAFDAASASAFVKRYRELPAESAERDSIFDAMSKEFGTRNTYLALETDGLVKALQRPVSQKQKHYEEIKDVREAFDTAYFLTSARGGIAVAPNDRSEINWGLFQSSLKRLSDHNGVYVPESLTKAVGDIMASNQAGQGAEWIPTELSADLAEEVYLSLVVAGLFPRRFMPTATWKRTMRNDRGRGYRMPQAGLPAHFYQSLATVQSSGTGQITYEAEKLATLQMYTDEFEADNVRNAVADLRQDVIWALAACIEDALLNGSTSLLDLDNQGAEGYKLWNNATDAGDNIRLATGTVDCRAAFDGLRKLVNSAARSDFGNAHPTFTLLNGLRALMGKYGVMETDLAYIVSPRTYINMITSITEIMTIDKFGPQATIVTGQLAKVGNIPVVVSAYAREDLETSGYFNTNDPGSSTHDRASILCVNRRGFGIGDRQAVRLETDRNMLAGLSMLLATWRGDFQKEFDAAENLVAEGFNVKK